MTSQALSHLYFIDRFVDAVTVSPFYNDLIDLHRSRMMLPQIKRKSRSAEQAEPCQNLDAA